MVKSIYEEKARVRGLIRRSGVSDEEHKNDSIKFLGSSKEREKDKNFRVLIVTSADFFRHRTSSMSVTDRFSEKVLEAVLNKCELLIVFSQLSDLQASQHLSGNDRIKLCVIDRDNVAVTQDRIVHLFIMCKIKVNFPRIRREFSWLKIKQYIQDPTVLVVGENDYKEIQIEPDKDLSFKELVQQRKRTGW